MQDANRSYLAFVNERLNPLGARRAKLCLTPYTHDSAFEERYRQIVASYALILEHVFQRYPVDARIRDVLGYSGELESHLETMTVYPRNLALARLDVFVTADGLRMVESNTETPGGNEECTTLEIGYQRFFSAPGLVRRERLQKVLDTLLDHYRVQMSHKGLEAKERPTINLITWDWDIQRIRGEYDVLIDFIRGAGCPCDILDPNRLEFRDGHAFSPSTGERVDLFYRRFTTDELPKNSSTGFALARRLNDSSAAVVNPFCTKRVDSKNIMVLIDDRELDDVFTPELMPHVERIRTVLPWTRKVSRAMVVDGARVDGGRFLRESRERLVIKEANSYSSVGVFLGEDATPAQWDEIVERALQGDHIVQEKIDLPTVGVTLFDGEREIHEELIYNVNPYLFNGQFGGLYVRASSDKLTSFKVGKVATVMPVFLRQEG